MSDSSRALMSRLPDWIPVPQSVLQRGLSARSIATAIAAPGVVVTPKFVVEDAIAHFEFWRTGAGARVTGSVADLTGREPRWRPDFGADYVLRVPTRG